jgi:hypothetical protein
VRVFENETFEGLNDCDSGTIFSDLEFHKCVFRSCTISNTHTPALRTTLRNIRLTKSSEYGCFVFAAMIEDVTIDGLSTHGDTLQTWGAVFKHVILQGKIDYLMTSDLLFAGQATAQEQREFNLANAEYYSHVDWALDISQGEFKAIDIRGVPGRLVRRDPETQVLISRQVAMRGDWRDLTFSTHMTPGCLQVFLDQNYEDMVFIAPRRDRQFREYLADIQLLRKAGIAEPD